MGRPSPRYRDQLEIYKLLVEMADRVSQRRQANNNFYLTVNTAIVAGNAYLANAQMEWTPIVAIASAGIIICVAWGWSIRSYRTLNRAKFAVIHELEKTMSVKPYSREWAHLTGRESGRHVQFHQVEVVVPWVFGGLHLVLLASQVPASAIRCGLHGLFS